MINTTFASDQSQLESLKQQLADSDLQKLEYVILAHSDDHMINRLKEAFVEESILVLAMPQMDWQMNDAPTDELLDWLLNEMKIERLLLVGHSQGGVPSDSVQLCVSGQIDPPSNGGATNRVSSLIDRINSGQSTLRKTEDHFVQQLNYLQSLAAVQNHPSPNEQIIQGLLYRGEVGTFCRYDSKSSQFQALIARE